MAGCQAAVLACQLALQADLEGAQPAWQMETPPGDHRQNWNLARQREFVFNTSLGSLLQFKS